MSTLDLPKISIVTVVLNRVATIEKAIQSVLNQNYPNLEYIIIDGGSTDGTVEIIEKYSDKLAYWHSQPDGSPSVAVNFGIEKATGTLIAFLMADDWYQPRVFQEVGQAFVNSPNADMITCAGRIVREMPHGYETGLSYTSERKLALNFYNVCFAVSAICCRFITKSFYERVGLYCTRNDKGKHMLCNDKEFLLRAILQGVKNVFIPVEGHIYLASPASSTFGNHKENIESLCYDHLWIAQTYLQRHDLTWIQRALLHYWRTDQLTRLFIYALLDNDFHKLIDIAKEGVHKYSLIWPFALFLNAIKISIKRISDRARN